MEITLMILGLAAIVAFGIWKVSKKKSYPDTPTGGGSRIEREPVDRDSDSPSFEK